MRAECAHVVFLGLIQETLDHVDHGPDKLLLLVLCDGRIARGDLRLREALVAEGFVNLPHLVLPDLLPQTITQLCQQVHHRRSQDQVLLVTLGR